MRHSRLLSILLLLTFLLAACGGSATPTTNTPEPFGEPTTSAEPTTEGNPGAAEQPLAGGQLTIYSGRNEELVGPLIEQFEAATGIDVSVRYGNTAEMAAAILEEGANSPADVYYGQDAGALGALTQEGMLAPLPPSILNQVNAAFHDAEGHWVGTSGRARVVVYNTGAVQATDIPTSITGFTDPAWKGRLGWAPTNGSFQAFVTALRVSAGEEAAREWLAGIQANEPKVYENNNAVLEAVAAGEIDAGFINHYYLMRRIQEVGAEPNVNMHFYMNGDIGGLINVAGAGVLETAANKEEALAFIEYLLSEEAQIYFRDQTSEYPLAAGVEADPQLPPLETLEAPDVDLNRLSDLNGTLELLQELGIL